MIKKCLKRQCRLNPTYGLIRQYRKAYTTIRLFPKENVHGIIIFHYLVLGCM